ncbi:ELMO/CED-12 family protein [Cryptosporidium felis]|nr:ELMO/CED-12 family protein [Cryptosporidium felis]
MLHSDINSERVASAFQDITTRNSFIPEVANNSQGNVESSNIRKVFNGVERKERYEIIISRRLCFFFAERSWKLSKERKSLHILRNKCLVPLNCTDPKHEQLFQDYWSLAYPDYPVINGISSNWRLLGFQNDDPRLDFKFGGLITLENMVYFAEQYRYIFRKILDDSRRSLLHVKTKCSDVDSNQGSRYSLLNSQNISVALTPCRTPDKINTSSSNLSIVSTPFNLKGNKNENYDNIEPLKQKIKESEPATNELNTQLQSEVINLSYPLSAALINVSTMICIYLNLVPSAYKIPGIPVRFASKRAMRNFIKLCNEFSFSAISELFSVCAIRFHAEWLEIVKFLGHNAATSEFDKVFKNVHTAMAGLIEKLPKDILEFRCICDLGKYY